MSSRDAEGATEIGNNPEEEQVTTQFSVSRDKDQVTTDNDNSLEN